MNPRVMLCILILALFAPMCQAEGLPFVDPDPGSVPPEDVIKRLQEKAKNECTGTEDNGPEDPTSLRECNAPGYGFNFEYHYQKGFCIKGECVMRTVEPGCTAGQQMINPGRPNEPQLGCAFLCFKEGSKTDLEYKFFNEGDECMHAVGLKELKKTTCKRWHNVTVCRETTPRPPGC